MFVDMELYRTFYYVAKNGNITRAAEELFITQPAVSQAIKQLEEKMCTPLFIRLPKGVKLTSEGQLLFSHVKEAFNIIQSAEKKIEEINSLDGGEIIIGVDDIICKYYLLSYIKEYHSKYPKVKIKTLNISSSEIIEGVKGGSLSFGIVKTPVDSNNLSLKECFDIQFCFAVGELYKDLVQKKLTVKDLLDYPFISIVKSERSWSFMDDFFSSLGLTFNAEIELSNYDMIAEFAKIGLGIGCLIENFIQEDLTNQSLYKLNIEEIIPVRKVAIATLKDLPISAPAEKFIEMLAL